MRPYQIYAGLLIVIVTLNGLFAHQCLAHSPYRMEGTVTDADTKRPVAGAIVSALIESEKDSEKRAVRGTADDQGRYSLELPIGHACSWTLLPPAGYYPAKVQDLELFATTAEKPVFTKNYEVRKGFAIKTLVRSPKGESIPPSTYVLITPQQANKHVGGYCELDRTGSGAITLPVVDGQFDVTCSDAQQSLAVPKGMEIEFASGFNPENIPKDAHRQEDGAKIVRDADGHSATVRGCDVLVETELLPARSR
jgi:hypothetical protein